MERHVVVEALARQLLDAFGMLRRQVRAQLEDDTALRGVDDNGVGLVEIGGQRLRYGGSHAKQRSDDGKNSDHDNSGSVDKG